MSRYPLIILVQQTRGGETTSLVQQAKNTGGQLGESTGNVFENVATFFGNILAYLVSIEFIGNLVATVVVVGLAILFYKLSMRFVPRILRWHLPEAEGGTTYRDRVRIQRRDTAVTLVRQILRYVTFAIVALFIVSIFLRNALPTVAGASILAAVLGFSAQSFFRDIIAGFFILFEGQYNVGDFIWVESAKAAGIVEEFGLRTTTLRTPSGEHVYIANGSITSVTKYGSGQQSYTIDVQLKNDEAADRVIEELEEQRGLELYLTSPQLMNREETSEGNIRLQLFAGVLPSTGWLVEENLIECIKAAAGEDGLAAEPLVYKVDRQSVRRLRNFMPSDQ
ncbi:MAG: mechanosensitive ion channel [Rubrobacter sp.]|nr:mechanosensitive ion channel [Rubrobacter sp.]